MRSSRESFAGWAAPGVVLVFLLVRKGLDVGAEPLGNLVYIVFTAGDGPEERLDLFGGNETVAVEAEAYVGSDKSGAFVAVEERMESDQAVNKRCDLGDEIEEQLLAREGGEGRARADSSAPGLVMPGNPPVSSMTRWWIMTSSGRDIQFTAPALRERGGAPRWSDSQGAQFASGALDRAEQRAGGCRLQLQWLRTRRLEPPAERRQAR